MVPEVPIINICILWENGRVSSLIWDNFWFCLQASKPYSPYYTYLGTSVLNSSFIYAQFYGTRGLFFDVPNKHPWVKVMWPPTIPFWSQIQTLEFIHFAAPLIKFFCFWMWSFTYLNPTFFESFSSSKRKNSSIWCSNQYFLMFFFTFSKVITLFYI